MEEVGAYLETTQGDFQDLQGAYTILKRWYRHASVTNLSWADLEKVSGEYTVLYHNEDSSPLRSQYPPTSPHFKLTMES